jgi:drug/metabolite transporter (DMT)-like permease
MSTTARAYIFLIITALGWGANSVIGKFAVGHIGPMSLTIARWCVAVGLIALISVPQIKQDWPQVRRYWWLLLAYGVLGFAAFNALLYTALKHTSAINCVIEQAGIPGFIFLLNYGLFRTKVSRGQIIGFTVTLLGVALTAARGSADTLLHLDFNIGDLMMLGAVFVYAVYTTMLRWKPQIHWKTLIAASATGALIASIPLFGYELASGGFIMPDRIGWLTILFTGLVHSLVCQILYVRGVELIGANRAGLFINAVPVFGTALSVVILGERFELYHLAALAMVLGGIAIAERGR